MRTYPEYKDSGVEWIGKIPTNWEVKKTTFVTNEIGSGTTPKSGEDKYYENGEIPWLITGDLNDGLIFGTSKKITPLAKEDYPTLKVYPEDSVSIAMYGATIGKLGYLKLSFYCQPSKLCFCFRSRKFSKILVLCISGKSVTYSFPQLWGRTTEHKSISTKISSVSYSTSPRTKTNLRLPRPKNSKDQRPDRKDGTEDRTP